MTQTCPTYLIPDDPVDEDAFGSHERIAHAILNIVNNEDGGKAIALTGPWGSGKSTVIKLLRKIAQLNASTQQATEVAIFVFDAWAHQGDPLRRTFLECFVKFLMEREWIERSRWDEKCNELTHRQEITEITYEPILSRTGKALAVALALMPFGVTVANNFGGSLRLLGLALTFSPFSIAIMAWIIQALRKRFGNGQPVQSSHEPSREDNIGPLFFQKTREVSRSLTIRTPDPTSVEFSSIFAQAVDEALATPDRRLLVVIDNLDRLDPHESLAMWSTMRTFFDAQGESTRSSLSRFWLLVPYDPIALERLWPSTLRDINRGELREDSFQPSQYSYRSVHELSSAFAAKTFQITLNVPPPILSDWSAFLSEQLEAAFPAHKERLDLITIRRLYHLVRAAPGNPPITPRDVKLFVNRVGALHRQWGDEIPLELQALYILIRERIQDVYTDFVQKTFLPTAVHRLVHNYEWQRYLAALHFNVHPDKSIQVLIGQQVEQAFMEYNLDELKRLTTVSGFWEVVNQFIDARLDNWATQQSSTLALVALMLDELATDDLTLEVTWGSLRHAATHVSSWQDIFDERVARGIAALLRRAPEGQRACLAQRAVSAVTETSPWEDKTDEWVSGVITLIREMDSLGLSEVVQEELRVSGTADIYISVVIAVSRRQEGDKFARFFVPKFSGADVVERLKAACKDRQIGVDLIQAIRLMVQIGPDWPWWDLVRSIRQQFEDQNLELPQARFLLQLLVILAKHNNTADAGVADDALRDLATHGRLLHHLERAHSASAPRAVAQILDILLSVNPEGRLDHHWADSASGQQYYNQLLAQPGQHESVVREYAEICYQSRAMVELLDLARRSPNAKALISAALNHLSITRTDFFSSDTMISAYTEFADMLQSDALDHLIIWLTTERQLICSITRSTFAPGYAYLYLKAWDSCPAEYKAEYTDFLVSGLATLPEVEWKKELIEDGLLIALVRKLLGEGASLRLQQEFLDPLLDHAIDVVAGGAVPAQDLSLLPNALTEGEQKTFYRTLRDRLLASGEESFTRALNYFGEGLLDSCVLNEKADEIVRRVCSYIVDNGKAVQLEWLRQLVGDPHFIESVRQESLSDLLGRIQRTLDSDDLDEAVRGILIDIRSMLQGTAG